MIKTNVDGVPLTADEVIDKTNIQGADMDDSDDDFDDEDQEGQDSDTETDTDTDESGSKTDKDEEDSETDTDTETDDNQEEDEGEEDDTKSKLDEKDKKSIEKILKKYKSPEEMAKAKLYSEREVSKTKQELIKLQEGVFNRDVASASEDPNVLYTLLKNTDEEYVDKVCEKAHNMTFDELVVYNLNQAKQKLITEKELYTNPDEFWTALNELDKQIVTLSEKAKFKKTSHESKTTVTDKELVNNFIKENFKFTEKESLKFTQIYNELVDGRKLTDEKKLNLLNKAKIIVSSEIKDANLKIIEKQKQMKGNGGSNTGLRSKSADVEISKKMGVSVDELKELKRLNPNGLLWN